METVGLAWNGKEAKAVDPADAKRRQAASLEG